MAENINNIVDKLIDLYREDFILKEINPKERKDHREFLIRQLEKHKDYYNYLKDEMIIFTDNNKNVLTTIEKNMKAVISYLLIDEAYIYLTMRGYQKVNNDGFGMVMINNEERLPLVRNRSCDWFDSRLQKINNRRLRFRKRYKNNKVIIKYLLTYKELVEDVIKDEKLIEQWKAILGEKLDYNKHIKISTKSRKNVDNAYHKTNGIKKGSCRFYRKSSGKRGRF